MSASAVIFLVFLHFIITIGGIFVVAHFHRRSMTHYDPENLTDEGLLEIVCSITDATPREAIESAFIADQRDVFVNHVTMAYLSFTETGHFAEYIHQHFVDFLNGDAPLIVQTKGVLIA